MILRSIISQQHRRTLKRGDDDIYLSIIIEVAKRGAAANYGITKTRSGGGGHVNKSFSCVQHQQRRLSVFQVWICLFDSIQHVALGHKNIAQSVIIGIDESCSPT